MTENFSIGATKHIVPIYERLMKDSEALKVHGLNLTLSVGRDGAFQLLNCELEVEDNTSEIIRDDGLAICCHHIAEAVAESIVIWWKPELVRNIIYDKYLNLTSSEIDAVLQKMFHASLEKSFYIHSVTTALTWKKEIAARVLYFLEAGNKVSVDGFINFRLGDFKLELEHLVDEAVEDYLLEKEYDDFIDLLRYFVNTQEPRLKKIHVVPTSFGAFNMYDPNYKLIDKDFLEGFILDLMDSDLTYEDLLVSALITIAPTEIVFHLPASVGEMTSAVNTIQSVFEERVTVCTGCSKCLTANIRK